MTWPDFLLWGNAIGSFIAGTVNFLMAATGRPYPGVKYLRAVLAYGYTGLYSMLLLGLDQEQGVIIGRSMALGAWVGVWIVPALLPVHDIKDVVSRVIERVGDGDSNLG